ncbi:unnamed protein product, partial [Polarella glacialis]
MGKFAVISVACLVAHEASAAFCAKDGSDYFYTESVSSSPKTRTVVSNGCPNHPWYQLSPSKPSLQKMTYTIPLYPQFLGSSTYSTSGYPAVDLSQTVDSIGIFFNGGMLFSPYAGPTYGQVKNYATSATYAKGSTFDQRGCHSNDLSNGLYGCSVPPHCLLNQLGQTSGSHSPQIGWAHDGFPIYGPRGPNGVQMQTREVTGGTYGSDVCTDVCGGYYLNDGTIDNYYYRYYIQGTYDDGTSCSNPGCTSPGGNYYPNTPVCFRGCCPSGVTCSSVVPACSGSYSNGYSAFTPAAPTINGLDLSSGLPTNSGACSCSSLSADACTSSSWATSASPWTTQEECCPKECTTTTSSTTASSTTTSSITTTSSTVT